LVPPLGAKNPSDATAPWSEDIIDFGSVVGYWSCVFETRCKSFLLRIIGVPRGTVSMDYDPCWIVFCASRF